MKRLVLTLLVGSLLFLVACSGGKKENENISDTYNIGIVQFIEHPALDNVKEGFLKSLDENNIKANIEFISAQGDISVARSGAEKLINNKVDLIFAIATPAAEAVAATNSDIPILFSAVTDPIGAELVDSLESPGGNITGTSDLVDIKKQLNIFKELNPNIKKIAFLYSLDEANSLAQLEMVKSFEKELSLEIVEFSIQNISDLPQVAQSLVNKVEGVYIPSDNKIASSISLISDILKENKLISVGSEEAHVESGILITEGINYLDLGIQTSNMAKKILVDGVLPSEIPVERGIEVSRVVNKEMVEALDFDIEDEVFTNAKIIE